MARKYDAQKAWSTRNARAQREHELKMKFFELLEKDDELKYWVILLGATGGIAAVSYLSSLQTAYLKKEAYEANKLPAFQEWLKTKGWSDTYNSTHNGILKRRMESKYEKEKGIQEDRIEGQNYQMWDEILGGGFGVAAGLAAGILITKAMWKNSGPPGCGSVLANAGIIGLSAVAGGAIGATGA